MEFDTRAEALATAPLPAADPGVQLAEAEQQALAASAEPHAGAVAAPPGTATIERPSLAQDNADAVALSLEAVKKVGGDAAGDAAFRHGTWNADSRQGTALKGTAKAGVNAVVSAAKIATAKTPEERQKAITDLATGTVGDVAGITGGAPVGSAAKGALAFALAKNAKERREAATDGAIDTAAEVAGKFGGDVAKTVVQSGGGLIDVLSKKSGSHERASTSQRHLKRLLGNIPGGIGNFIGNKLTGSINDDWARRNGGRYNAGDGTFTMPNGTIYDPKKGAPTAETTEAGPRELTEADKRRLDQDTTAATRR